MKCFLTLCLTLLTLALPAIVTAATEERTALVIGNGGYSTGSLKNPVNDADDMAVALKRLGFNVGNIGTLPIFMFDDLYGSG
ncbi:MAG: caspase family protein [Syntrophales bacterium]